MQVVSTVNDSQEQDKRITIEGLGSRKQLDTGSQTGDEHTKEARMDGGWRAWCSVLASFLQFAICLGGPNAFGVFQAEYSLVQFPEASDLVSYHSSCNPLSVRITGNKAGRVY